MFPGAGTVLNVCTVLVGAALGVAAGHRLPQRTRDVVLDGLGLVTLLAAGTSAAAVLEEPYVAAVGSSGAILVVLGAVIIGGIVGSLLRVEERLERLGHAIRRRARRRVRPATPGDEGTGGAAADRFVDGFVNASLVFCVGPLTILGALDDGLGRGIDKLALKAVLDGFASVAFAASFGWGVAASALTIAVVQGSLTLFALAVGDLLSPEQLLAFTATGGLLLVGVALRLLRIKAVPVGDLLPALLAAPALVYLVGLGR